MSSRSDFSHPGRVLVIHAHPDDPEFTAGGTLARWTEAGVDVAYVIVTDGSKGTVHPGIGSEELAIQRKEEQLRSANSLGVSEVVFLGYPDGEVYDTPALREELVRQIRLRRPSLVITHDPSARLIGDQRINHPDHLAVGQACLSAIFPLARDRLNFPEHETEGLTPHRVLHILLTQTSQPNLCFDISATMDRKLAAILLHTSQVEDPVGMNERIRQSAMQAATGKAFRYGEAFRYISLLR